MNTPQSAAEQFFATAAIFELRGIATDVFVLRDGGWCVQAHHVTMA